MNCPDDDFDIDVTPELWENINYSIDSDTKVITENKIGSYSQIPLRLAWSITIHKSQGLTFEKAIIDAQGAFAHGQTYVALSRCKTLKGLILKSKIHASHIISDSNVIAFTEHAEANQPDAIILQQSKSEFELNLISELFDFYNFLHPLGRLLDIYYKNRTVITGQIEEALINMKEGVTHLLKVGNGFKAQLKTLSETNKSAENNSGIQERFVKAIYYFSEQSKIQISQPFKTLSFTTDNKAIEKDINNLLDVIEEFIEVKTLYFNGLSSGFNVDAFLELRAKSVFLAKDKPKKSRKTVIDGTTNVALFELLRVLRNDIAKENDLIHYQVFTQKALYEICETLPISKNELLQVKGMGKTRVQKYGNAILKVIHTYCEENSIELSKDVEIFDESKVKKKKGDTNRTSLKLFKSGLSIQDIAIQRALNTNTVFGHLASFIASGEIEITELISETIYNELKEIIPKYSFQNLSDLKHQIDEKYTYGEIRLVMNELSKK